MELQHQLIPGSQAAGLRLADLGLTSLYNKVSQFLKNLSCTLSILPSSVLASFVSKLSSGGAKKGARSSNIVKFSQPQKGKASFLIIPAKVLGLTFIGLAQVTIPETDAEFAWARRPGVPPFYDLTMVPTYLFAPCLEADPRTELA